MGTDVPIQQSSAHPIPCPLPKRTILLPPRDESALLIPEVRLQIVTARACPEGPIRMGRNFPSETQPGKRMTQPRSHVPYDYDFNIRIRGHLKSRRGSLWDSGQYGNSIPVRASEARPRHRRGIEGNPSNLMQTHSLPWYYNSGRQMVKVQALKRSCRPSSGIPYMMMWLRSETYAGKANGTGVVKACHSHRDILNLLTYLSSRSY